MIVSEARRTANRLNGARSQGPITPEGKAISRKNGLKHGLSGEGIVGPEGDAEEIDRRVEDLTADMKPRSPAGAILIRKMATLSVRSERAAEQESAAIALRVRHAADDFDDERVELANQRFESLAENPRNNLRKLCKSPEGVERLIDAWRDLKADLSIDPKPNWTAAHLERAAHLLGERPEHARGTRLGALSRAFWGDFAALDKLDGEGLDDEDRQSWAKVRLFEQIDAEVAALEAHSETLDFETIEIDRAEAGARALFDPSKPATLARRYEAEAHRGFFKALKEFRQVEAESEAKAEAAPTPSAASRPASSVGSSRENAAMPGREPSRGFAEAPMVEFLPMIDADGQPMRAIPTPRTSG